MSLIVGVHGIGQQNETSETLAVKWEPALRGGVHLAGGALPENCLTCAAYGPLFRPSGRVRAAGQDHFHPEDLTEPEADLLAAMLDEARRTDPKRFPGADVPVRAAVPSSVQAALRLLTRSRFLVGLTESAFIGDLKQVVRYLSDPDVRAAAQQAVDDVVSADTRVIVAHSLGTVVAYEALFTHHARPNWTNVTTLVTLGSPLGISNLIFDKLAPTPVRGKGQWPPGVERWTNISDDGDLVALVKALGPQFGAGLVDIAVSNGATAHDVLPYLTAIETGQAIAEGTV